ncbi:MAG TPA: MMPL family transporter [Polyangiaceae bacterium]|nr:MMPL family transporter [Polyangiaceae bacterium]
MLLSLARLLGRKLVAWVVIAAVLVLAVVSLITAARVQHDDDVLAFLPRSNPEVRLFYEVNKRFGGLDVAVVGVGAPDVLAPDFIDRLGKVTKRLNETEGVAFALSLTSVDDFAPDPQKGGISVSYLVGAPPATPAEQAALRVKVMSRDQVVGNLVSADGKAALIYCFAAHNAVPKAVAARVREAVEQGFPRDEKHWGGAPFISTYIYNVTQEDLRRLAPWAVAVIVLITIASFRDIIGSALALLSTAIGIVMSVGLMGALGVPSNIMVGSMPVILFALGSAYSVHLLSRYYVLARGRDVEEALAATLCEVGPPVIASGLTTMAGLLSFLVMDIQPMRTFGLFTGIGILASLVLALTFVPAVIRVAQLKGKASAAINPTGVMARFCAFAQTRRLPVGIAAGVLSAAGLVFAVQVDTRMDNAAFFSKGSPPDQAERFLGEHFGGSQFIQLQVEGDMTDPHVLREIQALGDRVDLVPGVTSVNHVASVIAQINEAMEGDRRIPDTDAKVKLLYRFLEGKQAVSQLVTDDRRFALVQIKISASRPEDVEPILERVEAIGREAAGYIAVARTGPRRAEAEARVADLTLLRVQAASKLFGVPLSDDQIKAFRARLFELPEAPERAPLKASIAAFLGSDEFSGELPETPAGAADRIADALAGLSGKASDEALATAIGAALERPSGDEAVVDIADSVARPLEEIRRRQLASTRASVLLEKALIPLPPAEKGERYLAEVGNALLDLEKEAVLIPAPGAEAAVKLGIEATGLPLLHRGLSRSVAINQIKSLAVALGLVVIIMAAVYRSLWSSLLVNAPIAVTLILVYAVMGLLRIRLDIGTSMLASLIIGAGVDYAVHLTATWNAPSDRPLAEAAAAAGARSGPSIWLNALMVAAGFVVLTFGEARPLQNVGGLTAAAMILAALATFLVIPALARRHRYTSPTRIAGPVPASETESAVISSSQP